jgi:hypothetical protein
VKLLRQSEFPACWSWPIPDRTNAQDWDLLDSWQADRCAICGGTALTARQP